MTILTPADFPEVRAAISPDLGPSELPDQVIHRDVYQGAAEAEVLSVDPNAMVHTDPADRAHVRMATILLTASRLALRLTQVTNERFAQYLVQIVPRDLDALYSLLRSNAMGELAAISTMPQNFISSQLPVPMVLAPGGRGDVRPGHARPSMPPMWSGWWSSSP